jgi:hypothetical protein
LEAFLERSAWRGYRQADFPTESWLAQGEVLEARAEGPAVSLISRQRFADFDLSFDWRLPVGGNSGLLYKVTEEREAPWQSGPEMQLLDNGAHPDAHVPETSCGALYGLYAPQGSFLCPAGLFNIGRVSVRGFRVEHWLNGVRVLALRLGERRFSPARLEIQVPRSAAIRLRCRRAHRAAASRHRGCIPEYPPRHYGLAGTGLARLPY